MTSQIIYPLKDLHPLELLRYRNSILQCLQDSAFRLNVTCHPSLPINLAKEKLLQRFEMWRSAQSALLAKKANGTVVDETNDNAKPIITNVTETINNNNNNNPISNTTSSTIATTTTTPNKKFVEDQKSLDFSLFLNGSEAIQGLDFLHQIKRTPQPFEEVHREIYNEMVQVLEMPLMIYAKQSSTDMGNKTEGDPSSLNQLKKWFPQGTFNEMESKLMVSTAKKTTTRPSDAREIVVMFCREERIKRGGYESFVALLKYYQISDGIMISKLGSSSKIAKSVLAPLKPDSPFIRILRFEQLFENLMRYHPYTPLYRKMNITEVQALEWLYGTRENFPKLHQSQPVSQYYGFRPGDVVVAIFANKDWTKVTNIPDMIELDDSWSLPCDFCLVTSA